MATTTSNMGLVVPQVGDASPGYVTAIGNDLQALDVHDHSTGKGAPITPAGLNVNAAVAFNNNTASTLRNVQFSNQGTNLSTLADAGSVYVYNGNLYYSTTSGQPVQITNGTALATLVGAIGGDYATYQALVNYLHSSKQYNFYDETGTLATINTGGLGVTGNVTASGTANVTGTVTGGNLTTAGTLTAPTITSTGTSTLATANVTALTATNVTSSGTQNFTGTTNITSAQLGTSGSITGGASSTATVNTFTAGTGGVYSNAWTYNTAPSYWYYTPSNYGFIGASGMPASMAAYQPGASSTNVLSLNFYNGSIYLCLRLPRSGSIQGGYLFLVYSRGPTMSTTATVTVMSQVLTGSYNSSTPSTSYITPSLVTGTASAINLGTTSSADTSWLTLPIATTGLSTTQNVYLQINNPNTANTGILHIAGVGAYCSTTTADNWTPNF